MHFSFYLEINPPIWQMEYLRLKCAPQHGLCPQPHRTHIQLNDPEQGDEEQIEGNKETEGAADIRDSLALLRRWQEKVR